MQSGICICTYVHNVEKLVEQEKFKEQNWDISERHFQGKLSICHFGHKRHRFVSSASRVLENSVLRKVFWAQEGCGKRGLENTA